MPRKTHDVVTLDVANSEHAEGRVHEYRSADTPSGTIVISDHATLKVFYDPIRQRILGALHTPRSVGELGETLDESPNRLYYHVRLLEQHGLIVVAEERRAGSNVERLYGRAATRYEVATDLVAEGDRLAGPVAEDRMGRLLEHYRVLLTAPTPRDGEAITFVQTLTKTIAVERAAELSERLAALLGEYFGPDAPIDKTGVSYAALAVLTPDTETHR
jgi:DNA-binding transcriptional ArsR family regulator